MDVGGELHQEQGYTAEAVISYVFAVARKRGELAAAIAAARARRDAAVALQEKLLELERRVGREIVSWVALHRAVPAESAPKTGPPSFEPSSGSMSVPANS